MTPRLFIAILLVASAAVLEASVPGCDNKQCRMFCQHGFKKNSVGCEICECELQVCSEVQCPLGRICKSFTLDYSGHKIAKCIDPTFPPRCWPSADTGTCKANMDKFFYNTDKDECEQFVYGGCRGNENRFDTLVDCTVNCIKGLCSEVSCAMACGEAGFKLNKAGCPMCECNEQPPEPETGCSAIACMMACPHGKKSDENGCEICSCREPPASKIFSPVEGCEVKMCKKFCELGFEKNEDGCPLCQCVEPECPAIECPEYCDYGYERDSIGCQTCECGSDPCNFVTCPPKKPVCKAFVEKSGRWEPECHGPETQVWCSNVACMMECENGFTSDQFGCHICECRKEPKPALCPMVKCASNCKYGYKYESDGCRRCQCLPDPCEKHICVLTQVCEAFREKSYSYCSACPAMPRCIDDKDVKRVEIAIDYAHEGLESIKEEDIVPIFQSSISSMMYIDDEYIRGISLKSVEPSKSQFKFNLVSYGDRNLVDELKTFKEKILEYLESTFHYNGAKFTPQPESITAEFSSDPEIADTEKGNNNSEEPDQGNLALIVGCTVGAVVAIAVLVAIVVAITVTKRKHAAVRKNIAYKKVKKGPPPGGHHTHPPRERPTSEKVMEVKPANPAV